MLNSWYRTINLPISLDQFHRLPRNSAYLYEYFDGHAVLKPQPKTMNGLLALERKHAPSTITVEGEATIRPLDVDDWNRLPSLFAAAFHHMQPFASLNDEDRRTATTECLERTRTSGDGPLIASASFVAFAEERNDLIGAILITLIPRHDEGECWHGHWPELPTDAVQRRLGRPHLTWVFVAPRYACQSVGSWLLAHAGNALLDLGYNELASTFLIGHDPSMLWHWRNGFRLVRRPRLPG